MSELYKHIHTRLNISPRLKSHTTPYIFGFSGMCKIVFISIELTGPPAVKRAVYTAAHPLHFIR